MSSELSIELTASDTPLPQLNQFVLDMQKAGYEYLSGRVTGLFTLDGGLMGTVFLQDVPMYAVSANHVLVVHHGQVNLAYPAEVTGIIERRYTFVFGQTPNSATAKALKGVS